MKAALTKLRKNIRLYVVRHPLIVLVITAVILISVISINVVSCSAARFNADFSESGIVLSDSDWAENEKGFKYYAKDGYRNLIGIDISEWVGDVDFKAVKEDGVDFVILRVGYRGYVSGHFVFDNKLADYLKGASEAGLKIGLYIVSQAINEDEAVEEAQVALEHAQGYDIEMPVYIDLEPVYDTARTDHLTKDDYTKIAIAFCDYIESQGLRGGIYANEAWFSDKINFDKIKSYDIWLAKYTDTPSTDLPVNMWQYSSSGSVSGTDNWVDLNIRVSVDESKN